MLARKEALSRPKASDDVSTIESVRTIIRSIREHGDIKLFEFTEKWDKAKLSNLKVSPDEFSEADKALSPEVREALTTAIANIRKFHEAQRPRDIKVETSPGVVCEKRFVAIERVGLYIPGGTAPLPSTLMMLAVPAMVAGCQDIWLATPPRADGTVHPVILATARLLGVEKIVKCGGAQAIAALAYGTESVPKVDKIFGPGNTWVTHAKMQVAVDPEGAAIDIPAGPSEVMVIADHTANADSVAADLLSQAEHDTASQVVFICLHEPLAKQVEASLQNQLRQLPRASIAAQALASSVAILASSVEEAMQIANAYAAEHLILQVENARECARLIKHAGSVFIGPWTPESVGDYASGTNHVLPTYGFARAWSGVGVESFMKAISFQELTEDGLRQLGPTVEILAEAEGLMAHSRAVGIRLRQLASPSSPHSKGSKP